MNFREFMKQRDTLLARYQEALDLTETNVVAALGHLRPEPHAQEVPEKAHRCHLAEFWLDAFGLPRVLKPQALVSEGVRQSLKLLFEGFSARGLKALVPDDVYPVYLDIASEKKLAFSTYAAESEVTAETLGDHDVVLITNPAKPWGTWLEAREVAALKAWLMAQPTRRVVLDCVYTWEDSFKSQTLELFESGQAYILHSMSKGWVRPLTMGIALVPLQDVEMWTPVFRALTLPQDSLRIAQTLLTRYAAFPNELSRHLCAAEGRLRSALASRGVSLPERCATGGDRGAKVCAGERYHFIVEQDWQSLLTNHGVFALPLDVFGGRSSPRSVITSLRYVG